LASFFWSALYSISLSVSNHDTGICQAAKDVDASQDMLVDVFLRIENFFKRLESYIEVTPTAAMTDVIVKTMVEVLSIIAIATKEIKQGRPSVLISDYSLSLTDIFPEKIVKKLLGRNDIEDALKRLDSLTIEEARMAIAETLKVANRVDNKVTGGRDPFLCYQRISENGYLQM
jgi:hypothetical protein